MQTRWILCIGCALLLSACGGDGFGEGDDFYPDAFIDTTTGGESGADANAGDTFVPEEELVLQVPEAGRDFVFVASTSLDSVAKINARTLEIESLPVGDKPTVVRTRPTINTAAVLNTGSADVSVIHADLEAEARIARVKVDPGLNAMAISPSGDHVVLYFDDAAAEEGARPGPLQLVEVVRLREGEETSVALSVGFNVNDVVFDDASERAFVITDDQLNVIDLEAVLSDPDSYEPSDSIALADETLSGLIDREVTITTDGAFAVVRGSTSASLTIIEIATGERATVALRGPASDLDLLPDGEGVIAVIRAAVDEETEETLPAELVLAPLPEAFDDPEAGITRVEVPDTIPVGQVLVAPGAERAVVFSTAGEARTVGEFDVLTGALTPHRIGSGKPIRGAVMSPDGRHVFVKHEGQPGSSDPALRLEGFSLVDFQSDAGVPFDKLFQTEAEPFSAVFTPSGGHLLTISRDDARGVREAVVVNLDTFTMDVHTLGSPPVILGALPGVDAAYISQEHPVGRISFIDLIEARVQTVTGFELNSKIR